MRFLLFGCLIVYCSGEKLREEFNRVLREYRGNALQSESSATSNERLKHFKDCRKIIDKVNSDKTSSFTLTTNEFSIMTNSEVQQHMGLNINMSRSTDFEEVDSKLVARALPDSVDFRGAVPQIKNQGSCGSCWIFAATASMEFEIMKTTSKKLGLGLSEQEYLNCASGQCSKGNGCNGGWMSYCYDYNKRSNRIGLMEDISYEGRMQKCDTEGKTNALTDNDLKFATTHTIGDPSPQKMQELASQHVVSVAVAANTKFQLYKSGMYEDDCNSNGINHAVNIVGYDDKSWLVRNSWGERWGDDGHIRMQRSKNTACVLYVAVFPEVTCTSGRCQALDLNKYYNGGNNDGNNNNDDDNNNDNNDQYGCFEERHNNAQLKVKYKNFKKEDDVQKACTQESHCIGYSQLSAKKFQMVVATEKKKKNASFKYKCIEIPDDKATDDCVKNGLVWCAEKGECIHEHMCH